MTADEDSGPGISDFGFVSLGHPATRHGPNPKSEIHKSEIVLHLFAAISAGCAFACGAGAGMVSGASALSVTSCPGAGATMPS